MRLEPHPSPLSSWQLGATAVVVVVLVVVEVFFE
jgi:hypothetical protein